MCVETHCSASNYIITRCVSPASLPVSLREFRVAHCDSELVMDHVFHTLYYLPCGLRCVSHVENERFVHARRIVIKRMSCVESIDLCSVHRTAPRYKLQTARSGIFFGLWHRFSCRYFTKDHICSAISLCPLKCARMFVPVHD